MTDCMNEKKETERAAVISVLRSDGDAGQTETSLDELERLVDTAGGETVVRMVQARQAPDVRTFLGKGKIAELRDLCVNNLVTLVVADTELTPSQIRNMEDILSSDTSVRVIDRTMLILDIFALHARTAEGRLQVELAQLRYTAPRLIGKGTALSRQGGASGAIATRGPGESKLETDRRVIKRKMNAIEAELAEIEKRRATQRKARQRSEICSAAIVGYTNAGKSTLLNQLTDAGILAEDKLFATLDPTTRRFTLPGGEDVLLVDTVGFIRNLPHHLVRAFRSTLDEASFSDITIIVADASDHECESQLDVTEKLLEELGASGKPTLCLMNKCDRSGEAIPHPPAGIPSENVFYVSAVTGEGLDGFISRLEELVHEGSGLVTFDIPMSRQDVVAGIYRMAEVREISYGETVTVTALCDGYAKGHYAEWIKKQ